MKTIRTLAACVALVTLAGCTTRVYSAPIRAFPIESAATLPRGATRVSAEGSYASVAVFGSDAVTGSVRVQRGVAQNGTTDVVGEISGVVLATGDGSLSLYGGVKHQLNRYLAVTAGLGVGGTRVHQWETAPAEMRATRTGPIALGGHVGADGGLILSYENRYVVPILSGRVWASVPLASPTLHLPENRETNTVREYNVRSTVGFVGTLGVRVPVLWEGPRPRLALSAGISVGGMTNTQQDDGFAALHGGVELGF